MEAGPLRVRLFGLLVVLGALVAATPAAAHIGGSATIVVPLDHVNPGQPFPVIASDLGSDAVISFRIVNGARTAELGTAVAGPDGHFESTFTMPSDFPHGYAELIASADDGSATSTFVLVGPRTVNTPGRPGQPEWWQDPSVLLLVAGLSVGGLLIGWTLVRSRRRERAAVAAVAEARRGSTRRRARKR